MKETFLALQLRASSGMPHAAEDHRHHPDENINPQHTFVCPKYPGFSRANPILFGWDVSTINPTLGKGLDS